MSQRSLKSPQSRSAPKSPAKNDASFRQFLDVGAAYDQVDDPDHQNSQLNINDPKALEFLNGVNDHAELRQRRATRAKEKFDQLIKSISYNDCELPNAERKYKYEHDFQPFAFFYKFLAKKPGDPDPRGQPNWGRLKLWIPDTIVANDGECPPMWIYSTPEGYVHRSDSFTTKQILNKMSNQASPYELVAVQKKPHYREDLCGNDLRLISSNELTGIAGYLMMSRSEMIVLQKFVKPIGPKAFICRAVWRKDKNHNAWVITNKCNFNENDGKLSEYRRYCTAPRIFNSTTIVYTNRGRFIENTVPYLGNIVKFMKDYAYVNFSELIGDFIEDEKGIWWLVTIRGFVLDHSPNMNLKLIFNHGDELPGETPGWTQQQKQRMIEAYQRLKTCKYCELLFPEDELNHKMTLKMIMQTDKHLKQRGKDFDWLNRPEYQKNLDTTQLYQWHRVCQSCYELYEVTVHLQETAYKFSKTLGIPLEEEKRTDMVSITNIVRQEHELHERNSMPENWCLNLAPQKSIIVLKTNAEYDQSVQISLKRYRMIVLFQCVRDVPKDLDTSKNYYLEYTLFDTTIRYKIDLTKAMTLGNLKMSIMIPMHRARLFYFFTQSREGVLDFLKKQEAVTVNLLVDQGVLEGEATGPVKLRKIGTCDFPLQDFLSDKVIKREYCKVFSGRTLPILAWALQMTIGIIESGDEHLSKAKLTDHKGISYTTSEYYTCETFPKEWIQLFQVDLIRNNRGSTMTTRKLEDVAGSSAGDRTPMNPPKLLSNTTRARGRSNSTADGIPFLLFKKTGTQELIDSPGISPGINTSFGLGVPNQKTMNSKKRANQSVLFAESDHFNLNTSAKSIRREDVESKNDEENEDDDQETSRDPIEAMMAKEISDYEKSFARKRRTRASIAVTSLVRPTSKRGRDVARSHSRIALE